MILMSISRLKTEVFIQALEPGDVFQFSQGHAQDKPHFSKSWDI